VLSEALMSIAILAISITIMGSIITSAISMTTLSKNLMIAQGLATEGIEIVKSIRNTNWLKQPTDPNCWLRPDPIDGSTSPCATPSTGSSYNIVKSDSGFELVAHATELDVESKLGNLNDLAMYQLMIEEVTANQDATYKFERYIHDENETNPDLQTSFYRSIKFDHYGVNDAVITVRVEWLEGSKVRTLERTYKLYNYLD